MIWKKCIGGFGRDIRLNKPPKEWVTLKALFADSSKMANSRIFAGRKGMEETFESGRGISKPGKRGIQYA